MRWKINLVIEIMESTLITFINNSSNIFRITILYIFQISIRIKLSHFKILNNNCVSFPKIGTIISKKTNNNFQRPVEINYHEAWDKNLWNILLILDFVSRFVLRFVLYYWWSIASFQLVCLLLLLDNSSSRPWFKCP